MRKSIGAAYAKRLADSKWWEQYQDYASPAIIALSIQELTMPMSLLRFCIEQALGMNVPESDILTQTEEIRVTLLRKFKVEKTLDEVVAEVWPIMPLFVDPTHREPLKV